jgi:hypothetical protein
VGQLNSALAQRYQVLNPGKPLPGAFTLPQTATQKDFDRIDKVMQQTEQSQGTKAQQDTTNELRRQTFLLAQGKRDEAPVYAFNKQTGQQELTTRAAANASPGVYSNPLEVKETDVRKDMDLMRQLGDAQLNVSRYKIASDKMADLSVSDQRAVNALIGEDKFKAHFLGSELPVDWLNRLLTTENWAQLKPETQDAVIGYIGSRGAVVAYQKAVSGSGRSNKEQLALELQNIPAPTLPKAVRDKQFTRFQQNIDQTGAGLPKIPGIQTPQQIRQGIESEQAPATGAPNYTRPKPNVVVER